MPTYRPIDTHTNDVPQNRRLVPLRRSPNVLRSITVCPYPPNHIHNITNKTNTIDWQWATYATPKDPTSLLSRLDDQTQLTQPNHTHTDPLPHRPNPNNRPRKDLRLLLAPAKTQRHRRLRRRNPPHPPPLAAHRVHNRAVRSLHPLRRLPDHHWPVRGEYPRCRTVYSKGSGDVGGWEEEFRTACIERTCPRFL